MSSYTLAMIGGLGGFALFMYGMLLVSDGLKQASGPWFRKIMATLSTRRLQSFSLGLAMGTAMHSSATTVMAVGFLNAGLLTLTGAFPLIAGANVGTSFAMQFIAIDKAWIWAAFAIVGLPMRIIPGNERRIRAGQALMAVALLFLGMRLMNQAVLPFRDALAPMIAAVDGNDWPSMLGVAGASLIFTAIIQSSGATIGVLFSLASSGVLTDAVQMVPLIIGAHIGTCITALLGSMGTTPDARRGAMSHLMFNIITGAVAFALLPHIVDIIQHIGGPPIRQVANIHTLIMILGALLLVPMTPWMVKLLHATLRFKGGAQEPSFLVEELISDPPRALDAGDKELARLARIVRKGFALNRKLISEPSRHLYHHIRQAEDTVDLIRWSMRNYLIRVAGHATRNEDVRRLQWMNLFLTYLERISDHNENLADLSIDVHKHLNPSDLAYARVTCEQLYAGVEPLLTTLEQIWHSGVNERLICAKRIREMRSVYVPTSESIQSDVVARITDRKSEPLTGFFLTEYLSEMDRIVRHTKKIAGLIEKSVVPA